MDKRRKLMDALKNLTDAEKVEIKKWWGGAPGGGIPTLPKWIPSAIQKKFERAMEQEYENQMEAAGYDPEDDPLSFSETDFGETVGVAAVYEDGKLKERDLEKDEGGVWQGSIKPIPFSVGGKKYYLYGGYSGV